VEQAEDVADTNKKESFDLSIRRPKLSFMNVYSQSGLDVYFITFS
jgi:hypothetical protein